MAVFVNDSSLGHLSRTANNRRGSGSIVVPASVQVPGTNTLSFRQSTPGYIWGVTDLLLEENASPPPPSTPTLILGATDTARYGYRFEGHLGERERADFEFTGSGADLVLEHTAFDIDSATEVAVFVNDSSLGHLSRTANNRRGSDSIVVPASVQVPGTNTLSFRQSTPGYIWGVTDLFLEENASPPPPSTPTLILGATDTARYGYRFEGHLGERERADFEFTGSGADLVLEHTAFDIDSATEVAVFVNDSSLGHLSRTANNRRGSDSIVVPASVQVPGTNTLSFRQSTPGYIWGVTDLFLKESASPPPPTSIPDMPRIDDYELVFRDEFQGGLARRVQVVHGLALGSLTSRSTTSSSSTSTPSACTPASRTPRSR